MTSHQLAERRITNEMGKLKIDDEDAYAQKITKHSSNCDVEMKSNSSGEKKIELFRFYSRKNSPDQEVDFSNNEFQKAYKEVFSLNKKPSSEKENNPQMFMSNYVNSSRSNDNIDLYDTYMSFTETSPHPSNKTLNGNVKKFMYYDFSNIEQIINNKEDFEQKNNKLSQYLLEISQLTQNCENTDEVKNLTQIQAKILESMIALTVQHTGEKEDGNENRIII